MPEIATPVLAVSNLFGIAAGDEPASVMQGMIAAVTSLDARRGTFKTPYSGPVLISIWSPITPVQPVAF